MSERTLEEWVADMTTAHNNHAKAIEMLELQERNLNERLEAIEDTVDDIRKSVNILMEHLDLTIGG